MTAEQIRQLLLAPQRLDTLWGLRCPSHVFFDGNTAPNVSHQLLPFSKDRIGLVFIGPNAGQVTLANDGPVVLNNGLTISSTSGIIALSAREHGMVVQLPWFAIGSAVGSIISWIEINKPLQD